MRIMTLELEPYEHIREDPAPIFHDILSFEIVETLKIEWERPYVSILCPLDHAASSMGP